jgi:uncharacterized protein (TIGR02147 family)
MERANVFEYLDYREYLRDFYQHRKATEYGFSHRSFSRSAGLRSSNYLMLIMAGERNLAPEMAHQFAHACGLTQTESDYFCELVAFNQARSSAERGRCQQRLARFKQYRKIHKLEAAQAAYHSTWYLPAIRELTARPDFRADPKWIARTLLPKITTDQAEKALSTLVELGLLEPDDERGLRQRDALLSTGPGPLGHHIVDYHRAMLSLAADALDTIPREEREISSLTLCVSQETMLDIKERIRELRREILQLAELEGEPDRVVQVSFQLFPLSEKREESHA